MTASKFNKNLRVHVVCSGLPYGNGEANDVFYEFFRKAWLSLHPDLAALPVIGNGENQLPTIHVEDLTRFIRALADDSEKTITKQYLIAVDQSESSTQKEIMLAISRSLGSGAVQERALHEVMEEDWSEFLTLNLRFKVSDELLNLKSDWHCRGGITEETMRQLNAEFNHFRGLFPLKVYIGGPPAAGKTHFASRLADSYGIPHLKIKDMVEHAKVLENELGVEIRQKVEELKDIEVERYEKSKKKKDPEIKREDIKVRLPEDILQKLVKSHIAQPACMNKGFILDGFPRNLDDAKAVFLDQISGYEAPEENNEEPAEAE